MFILILKVFASKSMFSKILKGLGKNFSKEDIDKM